MKKDVLLTGTAGYPFDTDPPEHKHSGMMVDVQEAELGVFFAQNEENGVAKFKQFGEVVPPNSVCNLKFVRMISLSAGLANVAVP